MSGDIGIGKLLGLHRFEIPAERDAVHIAVIPVIAAEPLVPGDSVCLVEGESITVKRCYADVRLGVVDPFITSNIEPGDEFYLFLEPGSITSLRHNWEHSAFEPKTEINPDKIHAKKVLEAISENCGMSLDEMMEAANRWADYSEYTFENTEQYKNLTINEWKNFWEAYQIYAKRNISKNQQQNFFTCAC